MGKYKALNSKGKCYNCQIELFTECEICKFILIDDNEKLVCTLCKKGYYLDSNGNCVNLEKIQNCRRNIYKINSNFFIYYYSYNDLYYSFYDNDSDYYISHSDIYNYNESIKEFININLRQFNLSKSPICDYCEIGFYKNSENSCIPIKIENCSIISMIKNNLHYECYLFCSINQYPLVILNLNDSSNDNSYVTISEIYNNYYSNRNTILLNKLKPLLNQTYCINNSEDSDTNNLKNCVIALYLEKENKYICHICNEGYFLNKKTNECIEFNEKMNCEYENRGNETNPIFSCIKCNPNYDYYYNYYAYNRYKYDDEDYSSNYIMIKEGNISFCISGYETGLENCLSADIDTKYITNKYNCTSCKINHLIYSSQFYERDICQNIFEEIKTSQNINLNNYQYYSRVESIEGKCQNNTLFTPDGKYCYKCNEYNIGMPGCNSKCSFSLERREIIKCLDGCKPGYIESSEGICKECNNINSGCKKCHYDEYPNIYFGLKRKRKFICDECYSNYYILKNDKCISCSSIENGCDECIMENNEFKCKQYDSDYILDEKGHYSYCEYDSFIFEKKCIKCNDVNQGGIEGCYNCNNNGSKTFCYSCDEGYILLTNNRTCLKISECNKLKKHSQCLEITLENNNFFCLKCRDYRFSVLKGENESLCIYLPELNGYVDEDDDYNYEDLYHYNKTPDINNIYKYYYNYYIMRYFSHCVEVINLGTNDNPLYSCSKCYSSYYLYTEEKTNISYCIYYYNVDNYEETNCIEKKIKIMDKGMKFTCIKCQNSNILVYHEIDKVNYCNHTNDLEDGTIKISSDTATESKSILGESTTMTAESTTPATESKSILGESTTMTAESTTQATESKSILGESTTMTAESITLATESTNIANESKTIKDDDKTGNSEAIPKIQNTSSNNSKTGLLIGVVIGGIAVIISIIITILIYKKINKKKKEYQIFEIPDNSKTLNGMIENKEKANNILKELQLKVYDKKLIKDSKCVLCQKYFIDTSFVVTIKCKHTFHEKCFNNFIKSDFNCRRCPICNYLILGSENQIEKISIPEQINKTNQESSKKDMKNEY